MNLYHGSTVSVEAPCIMPVTRRLDFGPGFYTTSSEPQARRWAQIKKRREDALHAMVSVYNVNLSVNEAGLSIKRFESPVEEWLDFIMSNRMGEPLRHSYDVVSGPVANDTLYETLSLFERGILTRAETIVRLRAHELADQVVFVTDQGLSRLKFVKCIEVPS